ncbi:MAG: hypothetical protein KDM63_15665 [Verrucomicrobiae bacterium]|nr:hypothetical protein [Verrucomicrobiae bacterium]
MIRVFPLAAGLLCCLLSSCSKSTEPRQITGVRELAEDERKIKVVESSAERFRMPTQMAGGGGGGGMAPASEAGGGDLPFVWTTPEGWTAQTGVPMRDLSFTFGENGEGECYLSRLPGAGGGLAPNVNRWRKQMGLEALTEAEIVALPKKPMFGMEGTFVDVTGTFSGMGGGPGKENYRMLGVILSSDSGAVFVKLTGPADLVAAQQANFDAFCASLQPR